MQFEIFYNLLTALRTVSNMYAQAAQAQSCANHVQHIEHLSCATCRVVCYMVWRDSSAIKFDWVLKCIYFSLILLAEPLNRWRMGGNRSTQRKPLATSFRKCHIFKPQARFKPAQQHWWQARKADVLTVTPCVAPHAANILITPIGSLLNTLPASSLCSTGPWVQAVSVHVSWIPNQTVFIFPCQTPNKGYNRKLVYIVGNICARMSGTTLWVSSCVNQPTPHYVFKQKV